jgi:CrcB protein
LWISLGAVIGANLRYFAVHWFARLGTAFPWGTLVVNVTGSFILGFFLGWAIDRTLPDPRWRLLVAVGFCGGYTTYSSFAYEAVALFEQGQWLSSATYLLLTNVLSVAAVLAGVALARTSA